MKLSLFFAALSFAIAFPSLADEPATAPAAVSTERPADALDSLILTDGSIVRGVILSADATAVTLRLRSGEEKVIPRAEVRMINEWRAPPAPPRATPHRDGALTITEDGTAMLTSPGGLRTELTPIEVYKLVGRDDLATALTGRIAARRDVAIAGSVLATLGVAAVIGDFVYGVSHICFTYDTHCAHADPSVSSGLLYGGLAGIGVGIGVAVAGGAGIRPDAGGVEERRTLADAYNARVAQADPSGDNPTVAATPSVSPLATLRAAPVISGSARGLAVGISF